MERAEALPLLPAQYAVALRLSEAGATDDVIATALGIEESAIGPLLKIAEAKLARVLTDVERSEQQREQQREEA